MSQQRSRLALPTRAFSLQDVLTPLTLYVLAVLVRLYNYTAVPFIDGPRYHASRAVVTLMTNYPGESPHPPFFYFALRIWMELFGTGETPVRLFGVVAGALAVPAVYALGRELASRETGLYMATLMLFIPPGILYSQRTRMYAFVLALTPISFWMLLRLADNPNRRTAVGYILSSAALFYTVVLSAVVFVAQVLWTAIELLQETDTVSFSRRYAIGVFGALAIVTGVWMPYFLWNLLYFDQPVTGPGVTFKTLVQYSGGGLYALLASAALLAGTLALARLDADVTPDWLSVRDVNIRYVLLFVLWIGLSPTLLALGFEAWGEPYRLHYALMITTGIPVLNGYLVSRYPRRISLVLLAVLLASYVPQAQWVIGLPFV